MQGEGRDLERELGELEWGDVREVGEGRGGLSCREEGGNPQPCFPALSPQPFLLVQFPVPPLC